MHWNAWIRQGHRWLSMAFTLAGIGCFAAVGLGEPPEWVFYLPLPPLFVLLVSGLYLFALPYVAKARNG